MCGGAREGEGLTAAAESYNPSSPSPLFVTKLSLSRVPNQRRGLSGGQLWDGPTNPLFGFRFGGTEPKFEPGTRSREWDRGFPFPLSECVVVPL